MLINEIAAPYLTMVIAGTLGVPGEDREEFCEIIVCRADPQWASHAHNPAGNFRASLLVAHA